MAIYIEISELKKVLAYLVNINNCNDKQHLKEIEECTKLLFQNISAMKDVYVDNINDFRALKGEPCNNVICKTYSSFKKKSNIPLQDSNFVNNINGEKLKSVYIVGNPSLFDDFGVIAFNIDNIFRHKNMFKVVVEPIEEKKTVLSYPNNNKSGWEDLFCKIDTVDIDFSKSNSIVIADPYIFQSYSKSPLIGNKQFITLDFVIDILRHFLPNNCNTEFQITILTSYKYSGKDYCYKTNFDEYQVSDNIIVSYDSTTKITKMNDGSTFDLAKIQSIITNFIRREKPNLSFKLNVVLGDYPHDRYVITNNVYITSSSGFQFETERHNVIKLSYFYPFFIDVHKKMFNDDLKMIKYKIQPQHTSTNQNVINENRLFS